MAKEAAITTPRDAAPRPEAGGFRPVLSLRALVMFGLAFVGMNAGYTMFGVGTVKSQGHFALVYLLAMVAMTFTALSYGRMAMAFPEAGSTYAYAAKALHPAAGYFAGWAMILDYVFLPLISVIIVSVTMNKLAPQVPYSGWVILTATLITSANLRGIEMTARVTVVYNLLVGVSLVWFLSAAVRALLGGAGRGTLLSLEPFYHPATFSTEGLMAAAPVAILSFIGFDGITTLAEDSHNPQRNVPRATVLVCLIAGTLFVLQTYLGQLVWPDYTTFSPVETAFSEIGGRIGGAALYLTISGFVVGQALMSAVTGQASASRLLYGMARGGLLPRRVFCYVHPKLNTPIYSILLMGLIQLAVPLLINLAEAADLINFGACFGFMVVNLSVIRHYFVKQKNRAGRGFLLNLVFPLLGFVICAYIWVKLPTMAFTTGLIWTLLGLAYLISSRALRRAQFGA